MSTPVFHEPKGKLALQLDPDLKPRRKFSLLKFVFCVVAGLLICYGLATLIISFGLHFLPAFLGKPHTEVYQNQTWEQALTSGYHSEVVRPLIDENQSYDVLVTIWLRRTEEEKDTMRREMHEVRNTPDIYDSGVDWHSYDYYYKKDLIHEQPIFSDVVFRGLRLRNRDMFAEIPLQIPTQVFMSKHLSTSDLRASIVIIPSSPSLLDHVTDYSTWNSWLRMRPLTRLPPNSTKPPIQSFQDRLLDSFALNVDLIRMPEREVPNDFSYDRRSAPSGGVHVAV